MIYYIINVFRFVHFEVLLKMCVIKFYTLYIKTYYYKYIVPRKQITIIRKNDRYLKITKIKTNH